MAVESVVKSLEKSAFSQRLRCCAENGDDGAELLVMPAETPAISEVSFMLDDWLPAAKGATSPPSLNNDQAAPLTFSMWPQEEAMTGDTLCSGRVLYRRGYDPLKEAVLELMTHGFRVRIAGGAAGSAGSTGGAESAGGALGSGSGGTGNGGGCDEQLVALSWTPFCYIESLAQPNTFQLVLLRSDAVEERHHFMMPDEGNATAVAAARDNWVAVMSAALERVTSSLFPALGIDVWPLQTAPATANRIMASYLLIAKGPRCFSLGYCDLGSYCDGTAMINVYTNSRCERRIESIVLTAHTRVCTYAGTYSPVLHIGKHFLCARTRDEKEIWLRALTNVTTKLLFDAPEPELEELMVFRRAVLDRVTALRDLPGEGKYGDTSGALLPVLDHARVPALALNEAVLLLEPEPEDMAQAQPGGPDCPALGMSAAI
eukprot:NODE_5782_length_1735_cov_9.934701.p1 GENE.NODE_5782_length_1735_cov_9.934701~~NODE_5782_length_1735_cov_9.934701.p1  ORF type:complete len:431 (+),score=155.90 NODE_5782_length_1735_cov_9.934701:156-1448(+)